MMSSAEKDPHVTTVNGSSPLVYKMKGQKE